MIVVLVIDGNKVLKFDIAHLVTLNMSKEVVEVTQMPDGRHKLCITKSLLEKEGD